METKIETEINKGAPEFLSAEQVAAIRSDEFRVGGMKARDYTLGGDTVKMCRGGLRLDDDKDLIKNEVLIREAIKSKEKSELHFGEKLVVNALLELGKIEKIFGLPEKSMDRMVKLNFSNRTEIMMTDSGLVNMLAVLEHAKRLKEKGATDDQIKIEIAGHMFHESMHKAEMGIDDALLRGGRSQGEVTPITSQLAYYLVRGYAGPKGYDTNTVGEGIEEIKRGKDSILNYEVATCVAAQLLFEELKKAFPELAAETKGATTLDKCEEIAARFSPESKEMIIPALKEAIGQSADPEKFKEIINKLKETK